MTVELYKTLFEVLFLHEYYLTDPDQTSVFDTANIGDPAGYLQTRMQQDRPAVTALLQFVPSQATQEVFRNQQLRLVKTYSGFQVAVKVMASTQSDGTTRYAPAVAMAANCNLAFLIQSPGEALSAITNGRMKREIGALYFFSNSPVGGTKSSQVLSNPIPAQVMDGSYVYQQGELVSNSQGIQFAFYPAPVQAPAAGAVAVAAAAGAAAASVQAVDFGFVSGTGFVNESDRMLVGLVFNYTFTDSTGVTNASFVLKDATGSAIKTINFAGTAPLVSVSLDFSEDAQGNPLPISVLPDAGLSDPILYTLVLTGTNNYSKTFNLIFYSGAGELSGCWGLIQLQATVSGAGYSLLDANGLLTSPVFQIRCKSLPTFRRYQNNTGQRLAGPGTSLTNILQQTGTDLTTVQPVPLTYMPYFFVPNQWPPADDAAGGTAAGTGTGVAASGAASGGTAASGGATSPTPGAATVYLPGPYPGGSMDFVSNQLLSLIQVPQSTLFPVAATS
jgi:hypothetical protein